VEGFGSLIASMLGTGTGFSSFRDNFGVLGITKVDSIPFLLIHFTLVTTKLCSLSLVTV